MSGSHRNSSGFSGKSLFFEEGCIYNRDGMVRVAGFLSILGAFSAIFALQFIPRKGTETENTRCKNQNQRIAIYPRKGTETLLVWGDQKNSCIAIYTPQGDGNPDAPSSGMAQAGLQFIPRKGTETHSRSPLPTVHSNCNSYPARGRKSLLCPA